jgi:hypothetical protein
MPEESANQNTPDGAVNNTEAEAAGEQPTGSETQTESGAGRSYSQADLDRVTAKVRREEKAKLEKQIAQATLSETEKLRAENESLKQSIRAQAAERQLVDAITRAGADDPDAVVGWIQAKVSVEYDDDGKIANLRDVIAESKERLPNRFPKRPGSGNGGEGGHSSHAGISMNDIIRRAANR